MERASSFFLAHNSVIVNKEFATRAIKQAVHGIIPSHDRTYTTVAEVENLTRLFILFSKTFGREGSIQVQQFLQLSSNQGATVWQSAADGYCDSTLPALAQRVVHAYHNQAAIHASEKLCQYLRYIRLATFYREYAALVEQVQDPDGSLRESLARAGFKTKHGRSIPSVVNDYLLWHLEDKDFRQSPKSEAGVKARRRLTLDISHGHLYAALEDIFSAGIFVLLPPSKDNT